MVRPQGVGFEQAVRLCGRSRLDSGLAPEIGIRLSMALNRSAIARRIQKTRQVIEFSSLMAAATCRGQKAWARVFGNSPDFWLNVQRRSDLWEAMNSPRERERIERATPLGTVA